MKRWAVKQQGGSIEAERIKCVVFDFGFTLSPDHYFKIAPAGFPQWHEVIQEHIFRDESLTIPWMKGELTSRDIAGVIGRHIPMNVDTILATMEKGCEHLSLNLAVWNFAVMQKIEGRKVALVTANMDVFTKVVAPAHKLDRYFDVIVNSADEHEIRKEFLWPLAFERLGEGIGFANSLLIEDGESEPERFRKLGGYAYQYSGEKDFSKWVHSIDWSNKFHG